MRPTPTPRRKAALLALLAGLAVGSAARAQGTPGDPYERLNRRSFALDQVLERRAIRPAAVFYAHAVPSFLRARLRAAFSNVGEPIVLINDLLQGRPATAGRTFARLAVNTTFGLAGFFDVAARQLPHHDNGFGVTLGRYGVRPGPYVYLPVLGPSTFRDLAGSGVDIALNPLTWMRYPKDYIVGPVSTITGGAGPSRPGGRRPQGPGRPVHRRVRHPALGLPAEPPGADHRRAGGRQRPAQLRRPRRGPGRPPRGELERPRRRAAAPRRARSAGPAVRARGRRRPHRHHGAAGRARAAACAAGGFALEGARS